MRAHVSVSAVLRLVAVICDGDSNSNFLNRNFVHNAGRCVGSCADNFAFGGSLDVRLGWGGSDNGCGGGFDLGGSGGLDLGSSRSVGRLDGEDGDTTGSLAASWGVALGRDRGNARDDGCGSGLVGAAWLEWVGVSRTVLDRDVSAKTLGGASAVVLLENRGHVLDLAFSLLGLGLEGRREVLAVLDAAGGVGAVVHSSLKNVDVPAVNEIGMVSVA